MDSERRQPRLPICLEVAYRTAGAFLVSYSINLSKGGIFIETSTPLELGERVQLSFDVPGAGALTAEGVVAWTRLDSADGLPDGMGVKFDQLDERYGGLIDELVRNFIGLTVLVMSPAPERLALLCRYLKSIIACQLVEAADAALAEVALEAEADLLVVDLDVEPEMGLRALRAAKSRTAQTGNTTPVILLAADPARRAEGKSCGADETLATPPSYHDLQAAVIRTLSRPAAIR